MALQTSRFGRPWVAVIAVILIVVAVRILGTLVPVICIVATLLMSRIARMLPRSPYAAAAVLGSITAVAKAVPFALARLMGPSMDSAFAGAVALYEGTASLAGMIGATFAILRCRNSEFTSNVFLAAGAIVVTFIVGTLAQEVPAGSVFLLGFAVALGCMAGLCAICVFMEHRLE